MTVAAGVAFLVIGINESVFFAVVDHGLHLPPEFIGVLASAQGVGAVAGGLLTGRLVGRAGELAACEDLLRDGLGGHAEPPIPDHLPLNSCHPEFPGQGSGVAMAGMLVLAGDRFRIE